MTAILDRICNAFRKSNHTRHVPRLLGLEVTSLEDRLTPATLFVSLPVVPDAIGLYGRKVEVFETGGELIVGLDNGIENRIVARVNATGYDHVEIQGTSYEETFFVRGPGIRLTLHESANDTIYLVGTDINSASVPDGKDYVLVDNYYSGLDGRIINYEGLANQINVIALSGDDTIKVNCTTMPVQVQGEGGNDTLIVERSSLRTFITDSNSVLLNGGEGVNTFVIGNSAPISANQIYNDAYSMDLLRGGIRIVTNTLRDHLHIYDKADTTDNNYTFTDNLFTRNAYRVRYDMLSNITLHAGKGNDTIQANGVLAALVLNGNAGNDVMMGGRSADTLDGGDGHDIMIGGLGTDTLVGGKGDDVLFGGILSFASDTSRLNSLRTTWTTFSNSYDTRVSQMRSIFTTAVREDYSADILWGNSGTDWFWGTSTEVKDLQQIWVILPPPPGGTIWITFYYWEVNK
ncbi:MAG: hypothetical protein JNJ77_10520 [Planctomycetia bacterium]|nr:hypothetical protein [Planctomycetia bacterium]